MQRGQGWMNVGPNIVAFQTKEKLFVNTEITDDGVCPERAEIKDVLKELTTIRADMVAARLCHVPVWMKFIRTAGTAPGTSCITLPSGATTSARCSSGWPRWGCPH
jgi:hypothetical protein